MMSSWRQDTGAVTQRSLLWPVLSNTLINDFCQGTRTHPQQFTNITKLNRVANIPHGHTAFQRNLDREEK